MVSIPTSLLLESRLEIRCQFGRREIGVELEVKQSGKWTGQAKLSKRGSGRLRRVLYLAAAGSVRLQGSAFGVYSHRLIARGMKARDALMAVMRKMLMVAYHVLRTEEIYDPTKVCATVPTRSHTPSSANLVRVGA